MILIEENIPRDSISDFEGLNYVKQNDLHSKKKKKIQKYISSSSNGYFLNSAERAKSKAFKAAVHKKSYPKSFTIL